MFSNDRLIKDVSFGLTPARRSLIVAQDQSLARLAVLASKPACRMASYLACLILLRAMAITPFPGKVWTPLLYYLTSYGVNRTQKIFRLGVDMATKSGYNDDRREGSHEKARYFSTR